jgi:hypothetical protein
MPEILRRGAVIRVAGSGGAPAPALALAYVDLRFADGHVERWLGSGSLRDTEPVPRADLVAWGTEVAQEHSLIGDVGRAFGDVDRAALRAAPVEIVVEWNAALPSFD